MAADFGSLNSLTNGSFKQLHTPLAVERAGKDIIEPNKSELTLRPKSMADGVRAENLLKNDFCSGLLDVRDKRSRVEEDIKVIKKNNIMKIKE